MRQPKYMSPSSLKTWKQNRDEYYLKYLCETPPPKSEQTLAMAIGSGFDARIKSYLAQAVFGNQDPRFKLETIFEAQVEPQHRDKVLDISQYIFGCYKHFGALADLLIELQEASEEPCFEFTVENRVSHEADFSGVPILGKPDVYFVSKTGMIIVYDWKVNSYYRQTSPKPGYIKIIDLWDHTHCPASRYNGMSHKDAVLSSIGHIIFNTNHMLEDIDKDWAAQLAMYVWLLSIDEKGLIQGKDFIVGIDQITSINDVTPNSIEHPLLRVSRYRSKISPAFQTALWRDLKKAWEQIQSGQIFDNLTENETIIKCKELDNFHKAFRDDTDEERWYTKLLRNS